MILRWLTNFLSPAPAPTKLSGEHNAIVSVRAMHRIFRGHNEGVIRHLCQVAYLGDHTALCRVLGRYKMYVDTRDVGLASHLMLEGFWEMWVTDAMLTLVTEGMVVADIGANLGYFTILMSDLVGPGGHVHAFEPNPHLVGLMGKSVEVNGFTARVSAHHVALDARGEGECLLRIPAQDPKNAYIAPLSDPVPDDAIHVPTARFDSRAEWLDIDFAKIDVEGAEEQVWEGMQGVLDHGRLKTVILEFSPARYQDPTAFLGRLTAPGFALWRIDFARGVVRTDVADILSGDPFDDVMLVLRR